MFSVNSPQNAALHWFDFECSIYAKNRKKDPKICLHKFLDNAAIRRAWIQAVGRMSLPKDPHLCLKHFEENCFKECYLMKVRSMALSNLTKSLKPGAIPTLFSLKPPKRACESTPQRVEKREWERESDSRQVTQFKYKYKYKSPLVEHTRLYQNSSFTTFVKLPFILNVRYVILVVYKPPFEQDE